MASAISGSLAPMYFVPVGEQQDLALDLLGRRFGVQAEDGDAVFVDRAREVPPGPAGRASG
jgi:hypothetical protein